LKPISQSVILYHFTRSKNILAIGEIGRRMLGLGEAVGMFGKGGSTAKLERLVKGQE
jgi:hypothetical protein